MVGILFEIGGKNFNPDHLDNELDKAILMEAAKNVKRALGSLECPKHGKNPIVTIKGNDVINLSCEVDGCCQRLIDMATERLK